MTKKDSTCSLNVENKQSSFQLPNRTTRLTYPPRGRRLSLVQELNQTVEIDSCITADPNFNYMNTESADSIPCSKRSTRRRPERTSTDVISEAEELDVFPDSQDVPDIIQGGDIRQEAGLSHFDKDKSAIDHAVSRLKVELGGDINELNSKLKRIENQLSLVVNMLEVGARPELKPRHTQSFPTSTAARSPRHHSASSTTINLSPDEASTSSPTSSAGNRVASEDSRRETSSPRHDRNNNDSSPQPLARFGRRKINPSETK